MKPLWQQLPQKVQVWEKCGCDLLCFPSPTVNECSLYHTLIMRQTLSGSARLPVYEECMCRLCVSNVTEKREEVCAECSCASSPHETKGDFAFLEGPCEAVKLFTELKIYVMFSVSVHFFFINTTPFGRGSHALPCMDSGVTWVYSWTLNRNKKKKEA